MAGRPLRPATDRRLGGPLPRQPANQSSAAPFAPGLAVPGFHPQVLCGIVADSVVGKLQEYIITYRTSKAKEDCLYLEKLFKERQQEYYIAQKEYANYMDSHDDIILQSVRTEQERLQNDMNLAYQVYSQVANQLQVSNFRQARYPLPDCHRSHPNS